MSAKDLQAKFEEINTVFSATVQTYLADSQCDADTKNALDEISRQVFYAIVETQNAIVNYLDNQ